MTYQLTIRSEQVSDMKITNEYMHGGLCYFQFLKTYYPEVIDWALCTGGEVYTFENEAMCNWFLLRAS